MLAIDTNVLVRLLARDDSAQVLAAEQASTGGAWISLLVVAETVWVLKSRYGFQPDKIATALELLLRNDSLVVDQADVIEKAIVRLRLHPTVGFFDCLILEQARAAGCLPLVTFDQNLGRLDGVQVL
jgi:predicted nucleic-acid-binding protein